MLALRGYVDDNRQISEPMRRGTRFDKNKQRYMWREDWDREDQEMDEPDEARMGRVCLEGMNSVSSMLTFTSETVYDLPNKMLPSLDLQVEVIKVEYKNQLIDQISFTFFH